MLPLSRRLPPVALASVLLLASCSSAPDSPESVAATAAATAPVAADAQREPDEGEAEPMLAKAGVEHVTVAEAFVSPATPEDNIDSPAAWDAPDGSVLLVGTAKKTSKLVLYDGDTGAAKGSKAGPGVGAGQLERPNGIFIADDLVFVVERDNHRVQVLRLPSFEPLGSFGAAELRKPYGIWLRPGDSAGHYDVLVTDAYMAGEDAAGNEIVPPLSELGSRLRRYKVNVDAKGLRATPAGSIGNTSVEGAIRVPESVWGDPANDRLLIAEEDVPTGTALREYRIDGSFAGRTLGLGLYKAQAEGIALWACPDGSGYWLGTDQFHDRTLFHVFDRQSLAHLGAFAGNTVSNTDGVWLHQGKTRRFPDGVFYAVHDDQAVAAFDWRDIAKALQLRLSCAVRQSEQR